MNISDIKAIESYEQLSPKAIADALNADPRLKRDITTADARSLMRERRLWLRDPITNAMNGGKIGAAMADPVFPAELYEGLVEFAAALYDQSAETISTHSLVERASQAAAIIGSLRAMSVITDEDVAAWEAMGGGRMFGSVTTPDVEAELAADQKMQIMDAAISTAQGKVNAMYSWLSTEEALAKSVANYQAYADELLASSDGNPTGAE